MSGLHDNGNGSALEQIPPHSEDSENAALGCMLLDSRAAEIVIEELTTEDFYLPRNRLLFQLLIPLFQQTGNLDEVFVVEELTRLGQIERIGGRDRIGHLIIETPGAAGVEGYCSTIQSHTAERDVLNAAGKLLQLVREPSASTAELLDRAQSIFSETINRRQINGVGQSISDLLKYDTENDATCLLGNRWLCKGGSLLLVGQSGIGKSSFEMQGAITWAHGEPFFGIIPHRPLKSLIIQAENDKGDSAEMCKGVVNGMGLAAEFDNVDDMVIVVPECVRTGKDFCRYVRELVKKYKPDITWIDPFLAYLGGNVSDQECVSAFLRNGLNPIAQEFGTVMAIVLHTPKPAKDPKSRNGFVGGDFSYLGIGSVELPNWARAILTLRETEEGMYELRGPKRGNRCGLKEPIYLRHSSKGICWEKIEQQGTLESDFEQVESLFEDFPAEGLKSKRLLAIVMRIWGVRERKAYEVVRRLKLAQRLWYTSSTGTYTKIRPC